MAVPKRKTSPSKRNMRRSHDALKPTSFRNARIAASFACRTISAPSCGHYKGREILKTEA